MIHTQVMSAQQLFDEYCAGHRQLIDQALQAVLDEFSADRTCPPRLIEAMRYTLLLPGKRVRPLLALMAAEACGGEAAQAIPGACAVEMIHAMSLIHDDLPAMDDDDMRRGQPANHKVFGEAQAILAGDALLAGAFQVLARGVAPPALAAECCLTLARAVGPAGICGGQYVDIEGLSDSATVDGLTLLHQRKTGALVRAALLLGALVAGAADEYRERLDVYGDRLGLAFQVIDDVLDVEGSTEAIGKTQGKDAAQGKVTFPALLGVAASRAYAQTLVDEARRAIEAFGQRAWHLQAMAEYVLVRES